MLITQGCVDARDGQLVDRVDRFAIFGWLDRLFIYLYSYPQNVGGVFFRFSLCVFEKPKHVENVNTTELET